MDIIDLNGRRRRYQATKGTAPEPRPILSTPYDHGYLAGMRAAVINSEIKLYTFFALGVCAGIVITALYVVAFARLP